MADQKKTPAPTSAPSRPRANLDDPRKPGQTEDTRAGTAGAVADPNAKELPGGADPRDPQYPGKYSTSENVTTDEQEAAQSKDREITGADVGPYATASRAEQIESQKAAAENPLAPQSTTISEPHTSIAGQGLNAPPRPEGQKSPVPQGKGSPATWRYDPVTGQPLAGNTTSVESSAKSRQRARLEDEGEDEDVEVELAQPVMLTDDAGASHRYEAGRQKVPRSHAEHWYLKQHLVKKDDTKKSEAKKSDEK